MIAVVNRTFNHRIEVVAALGLACLYLAVMSGHLNSIDGVVMWRQALALAYHHSFAFVPPIWWGSYLSSSGRGIGASLQYIPGAIAFQWIAPFAPKPNSPAYDWGLLYSDRLYRVVGGPLWVLITAATAYLVGLSAREIVKDRRAVLWAMAFYGLGSPAFAASRGDTPQALVAICWALTIFACLRYRSTRSGRWAWLAAASILYGALTRPLEGSLIVPAAVLLIGAGEWRGRPWPAALQVAALGVAGASTLLLNWERFGSPLNTGYASTDLQWTNPIWVGLPGALISPGRGVLWEFPALVLTVVGAAFLWRHGRRLVAVVLAGLPAVLLVEACLYFDWVGGWDWGFRFFQPALPLVAVLAGIGVMQLPASLKGWLPAVLLAGGLLWNLPAVTTDVLGGYGATYQYTASNFRLDAYPPIGAWRFLHHIRASSPADQSAVDIVWFREARTWGWISVIPFFVLLGASAALWAAAAKAGLSTAGARAQGPRHEVAT